jgi:predicted Fe-Mo cluster-binding NifX family protein
MKSQFVIDLLKSNSNRFTPVQLEKATGSPRRARRALFLARKEGVILEAIRDGGRAVTAYVLSGSMPAIASAPARKASKAASPKIAAKAKSVKVKEVDVSRISNEAKAAIKAKNLETIKTVHAKTKQNVAKHPITGRDLTDEQADVLEEFRALEFAYETEEQTRNAARAAVRENLPKEFYAE